MTGHGAIVLELRFWPELVESEFRILINLSLRLAWQRSDQLWFVCRLCVWSHSRSFAVPLNPTTVIMDPGTLE